MVFLCLCSSSWAGSVDIPIEINSWFGLTPSGVTTVTQEVDGIKFTVSDAYRTSATLFYRTALNLSDSTINYKFMAHGGGYFMDSNIGLLYDNGSTSPDWIMGTRYTTGNPFSSYQIPEDVWLYATLRITPDKNWTINLCSNNYNNMAGSQLLNTQSGTIADNVWQYITNAKVALSIGDNRNWITTQWMKIGGASYDSVTVGNATTYNALADFSTISSSGVWSYGEGTTGSNFMLLNNKVDCTNLQGWLSSQGWRDSGLPVVEKKTGIVGEHPCDFGGTIPDDLLVVAPAGNSTRSDVIIQWKAPATAVYNVSWTFYRVNNSYSDGVRTLVFKNSSKVYELVLGPGQQTTSSQTLSLSVGDVLSFGVNDVSWGNGDTSGFNAIITSTPTPQPVVSGSVKTASGTGVSGVSINFSNSGGTATTNASGNYSVTLANGYSGTATPSKTGYTFTPATKSYSNLTTNQTGQDYTATLPPVAVSGSVKTASGTGVSGVLITFSNSGGTATTDGSGNYSINVPNGYTGTATPSKTGYTFSPTTRTYSNLTTNQTGQDYAATPPPVVVSGSVKPASGIGVSGC